MENNTFEQTSYAEQVEKKRALIKKMAAINVEETRNKANSEDEFLADSVKVLSPMQMVLKRFFRSRLSMIGLITIICLFLFSFLGPIFSPWGEIQRDDTPGDTVYSEKITIYQEEFDENLVPADRVEKEREVLTEQATNEGLDANKLPMIVNGRLNKFFEEVCLVDQGFIKENKMKVSKYVESKNMKILSFVRYEVGEGLEKREENFADEVAKQING